MFNALSWFFVVALLAMWSLAAPALAGGLTVTACLIWGGGGTSANAGASLAAG